MLSIDDPTFWAGLDPLEFGPIPDLLEDVSVIGYPVGGDSISISSGVVSRIEMQEYAQVSWSICPDLFVYLFFCKNLYKLPELSRITELLLIYKFIFKELDKLNKR